MNNARIATLLVPVLLAAAGISQPAHAQTPQCIVAGNPSGWGVNSIGYVSVTPGSSCMLSLNFIQGEIFSSEVVQSPSQGSLQRIDRSSYVYTASPGASGSDSFAFQMTGQSQSSSGTTVLTINVSIQ